MFVVAGLDSQHGRVFRGGGKRASAVYPVVDVILDLVPNTNNSIKLLMIYHTKDYHSMFYWHVSFGVTCQ